MIILVVEIRVENSASGGRYQILDIFKFGCVIVLKERGIKEEFRILVGGPT